LLFECASFKLDKLTAMYNFIEDYLNNPAQAVSNARDAAALRFNDVDIADDLIYAQMSSPEFSLYEEIVLS